MTTYYKHVGKVKNSGRRCVVIKDRIPGAEKNALIVDIDSVPDAYQQFLMDLVQSPAAQATNDLGEVLNRYQSPDAHQTMLMSLKNRQYLSPMPITNIIMYPAPNFPIELTEVIQRIDGTYKKEDYAANTLHNTMNTLNANEYEKNEKVARNILLEAERLEFEARKKRDMAFAMAPQLNPAVSSLESVDEFEDRFYGENKATEQNFTRTPHVPTHNETLKDIGDKIGKAPPMEPVPLTPEQEILAKICNPNYVEPAHIEEKVEVVVEEKAAPKKRGRKSKTSK